MIPVLGEWLVRISVWIAIVCYPAGPLAIGTGLGPRTLRWARWIWIVGCGAFLVHTVSSFHYYYAWSHQVALAETAKQAAELASVESGSGLYLNYLFTLLWLADVVWWWRWPSSHARRPLGLSLTLHGFMFFMVFNGSVVFASGLSRVLGLMVSIAVLVSAGVRYRQWRRR